jgi:metal-responsive CopG/Arc/MetJ family transcriptional regulator
VPKTKAKTKNRVNIRLPKPMLDEVDRITTKIPMYGSRQQFVESAIREKLEKVLRLEVGLRLDDEPPPQQNQ